MTSFSYVVSYCHLSTTLQTISIIVVNLQDNRAVVRIFIALLKFSFDSLSYNLYTIYFQFVYLTTLSVMQAVWRI